MPQIGDAQIVSRNSSQTTGGDNVFLGIADIAPDQHMVRSDGTTGDQLWADNSSAESLTVNDLRRSIRLQEWLEKNARGGSRYIEQILSHLV